MGNVLTLITTEQFATEQALAGAITGEIWGDRTGEALVDLGAVMVSAHIDDGTTTDTFFTDVQSYQEARHKGDAQSQRQFLEKLALGISRYYEQIRPHLALKSLRTQRFASQADALKHLRRDLGAKRVDSQGAPATEGTAATGGRKDIHQAAGKTGGVSDPITRDFMNGVQRAHQLYVGLLSTYYEWGDIVGAREAHEGMARTGMAALTRFFNSVIVPQIDRGEGEKLAANLFGFFTNMGFVEEHLWWARVLNPQRLSISTVESAIFNERGETAGQMLAWVAGILRAPDIVGAARKALPYMKKLLPLLELSPRGHVGLLLERVDRLKTAKIVDLIAIRRHYNHIRSFIQENIPPEQQGLLLKQVNDAIANMHESGTQRIMPDKPASWKQPVLKGYGGPHIIPLYDIPLSRDATPSQRLERAVLLEKAGGMENLQRAILIYTSVFHTYTSQPSEQITMVLEDLVRVYSLMAKMLRENAETLPDGVRRISILRLADFHSTGAKKYGEALAKLGSK